MNRLQKVVDEANNAGFKIRVALILTPGDLGTAFSLFDKPQRYAEFLGFELSFVYRDRLLVVMPNGYGFSVAGKKDLRESHLLARLPPAGRNATKEAEAAVAAVKRLAAGSGVRLSVPSGGGSSSRDRLTIAAAATAAIALSAGVVLYRRARRTPKD